MRKHFFIYSILLLGLAGFTVLMGACKLSLWDTLGAVTLEVDLTIDGAGDGNGYLTLSRETESIKKLTKASTSKTYTFEWVSVISDLIIGYFVDKNGNGEFDEDSFAETSSFTVVKKLNLRDYTPSSGKVTVEAKLLQMSGTVDCTNINGDWPTASRRYICSVNSLEGKQRIIPVESDGSVDFYLGSIKDGSFYDLYAFYDTDNDRVMSELDDKIAYLITNGHSAGNPDIDITLIKVSGTITRSAGTQANGIYDFASGTPPVLCIEDQTYWRKVYQPVQSSGAYEVYAVDTHTISIAMNHVSSEIDNYRKEYKRYCIMPVRLDTPGVYGTNQALSPTIHRVRITFTNNQVDYPEKNLAVACGVGWRAVQFPFHLYIDDDTVADGGLDAGGTVYYTYFRNYTYNASYGSFEIRMFVDVNDDVAYNPEDSVTNIFTSGSSINSDDQFTINLDVQ
ncbi:MAG: hypothetical protein JW881_20290 [Spirochaetales bacterium]|nr:hypothetical protein [Spirochaetales bacterium]